MNNTVLIVSAHHPVLTESLDKIGLPYTIQVQKEWDTVIESIELDNICGIVTSNACYLDEAKLKLFPNLKFVARLGSGMEIIDTVYCESHQIQCWSSPLGNANAVAEHALGMIFGLINNFRKSHLEIIDGAFLRKENTSHELGHYKVGIIGLGSNGTLLAQKLLMLGCQVIAYDINPERKNAIEHPLLTFVDAVDHLYDCSIISLHIPLNASTKHYINDDFIKAMKAPFYLINCARGPLVNTLSLYNGLISQKILGAGIDVWEYEPVTSYPQEMKKLVDKIVLLPQVIATSHIAGYSFEATYKMSYIISQAIEEWYKNNF